MFHRAISIHRRCSGIHYQLTVVKKSKNIGLCADAALSIALCLMFAGWGISALPDEPEEFAFAMLLTLVAFVLSLCAFDALEVAVEKELNLGPASMRRQDVRRFNLFCSLLQEDLRSTVPEINEEVLGLLRIEHQVITAKQPFSGAVSWFLVSLFIAILGGVAGQKELISQSALGIVFLLLLLSLWYAFAARELFPRKRAALAELEKFLALVNFQLAANTCPRSTLPLPSH